MSILSTGTKHELSILSDEDLITKYKSTKQQQYCETLYKRYQSKVYRTCLHILQDEHIAQDITQDIFIKVLKHIDTFNNQSTFSTWLYTVTYNQCIDVVRKKKKYPTQSININQEGEFIDPAQSDAAILEYKLALLEIVLQLLPEDDKNLLYGKYHEGDSIKTIASRLNQSNSAIKMRLSRAKQKVYDIAQALQNKDLAL